MTHQVLNVIGNPKFLILKKSNKKWSKKN